MFAKRGFTMKVKINLDFDIELSQDGQRMSFSDLLHTAQTAAVNAAQNVAAQNVAESVTPSSLQPNTSARPAQQGQPASEAEAGSETEAGSGTETGDGPEAGSETETGDGPTAKTEAGTSTDERVGSDTRASSAFHSEMNLQTLHPLGVFLCDLLDRAADVSRQVNDQVVKTQERADKR
jgi:hypothetical protein